MQKTSDRITSDSRIGNVLVFIVATLLIGVLVCGMAIELFGVRTS